MGGFIDFKRKGVGLGKGKRLWKRVSAKLPTYPSPKPTFCHKWEVIVNIGLGEG